MYVLKIFITGGDIYHFGYAGVTKKPWDWAKQLSKACYLLEIILNWNIIIISCNILNI